MTMLDKFKPTKHEGQRRMPRGEIDGGPFAEVQAKTNPSLRPVHVEEYADEAKRAAQRYLDQVAQNEVLKEDADGWRHRCMVRDVQIEQLQQTNAALVAELDRHKQTLAVIRSHYDIAGKILLDGLTAITDLGGEQRRAKIDVPAMTEAIAEPEADLGPVVS